MSKGNIHSVSALNTKKRSSSLELFKLCADGIVRARLVSRSIVASLCGIQAETRAAPDCLLIQSRGETTRAASTRCGGSVVCCCLFEQCEHRPGPRRFHSALHGWWYRCSLRRQWRARERRRRASNLRRINRCRVLGRGCHGCERERGPGHGERAHDRHRLSSPSSHLVCSRCVGRYRRPCAARAHGRHQHGGRGSRHQRGPRLWLPGRRRPRSYSSTVAG